MQSVAGSSRWFAAALSSEAHITSLSPGAELFIGYSVRELIGRPIAQILANPTSFEAPKILSVAKESGYWQGEIVCRTRDGKQFRARGALLALAGDQGLPDGYLLISNLSQSAALNDDENAAVAEMAVKLRTLAHDLNNSLAVMMGFAQLLILNQNCHGSIREDIEKLYSELKRMTQGVERLHAYARSLYEQPQGEQESNAAI
jgi:PAS domain S-box-containing protein